MKKVERLPREQFGSNQKALLQTVAKRVMSRTFERQMGELVNRIALLNRFTHLGRLITVSALA